MGTSIQWTNETWNPVTGCSKVSQGCKNCYAERIWKQVYGFRPFTDVRCHPERLEQPLRRRKPTMWFVNSMSDLFHEKIPIRFITEVFNVMASGSLNCHRRHEHDELCGSDNPHIFQILTKRPQRMLDILEVGGELDADVAQYWPGDSPIALAFETDSYPLRNVWLGVSVENQETAEERIPVLLRTPAAVRFLSVEPMLEAIKLDHVHYGNGARLNCLVKVDYPNIDWVIIGGESGTKEKSRPFDLRWAYEIIEQCKAAGIPVFVKQLGRNPVFSGGNGKAAITNLNLKDWHGGDMAEWPEDLRIREFPRSA